MYSFIYKKSAMCAFFHIKLQKEKNNRQYFSKILFHVKVLKIFFFFYFHIHLRIVRSIFIKKFHQCLHHFSTKYLKIWNKCDFSGARSSRAPADWHPSESSSLPETSYSHLLVLFVFVTFIFLSLSSSLFFGYSIFHYFVILSRSLIDNYWKT